MNDDIKTQVANSRRRSMDGSKITYDLSNGVDFSHPRWTAEALAEVVFEQDISRWITEDSGKLAVNPAYKAEILITSENSKKVEKTIDDFKKDLENDELKNHYSGAMETAATFNAGIGTYLLAGFMDAMLIESSQRNQEKRDYLDKVFKQVMVSIDVKTLI